MLKSAKSVLAHSSQVNNQPAQRQARFGAVLLTALTLSAVLLLAAACGGESVARVATPAQAPEGEPEHTHGLDDDDGHTHEDGTEHTHDDEVGPGVPVVDVESDFWGESRLPGYEDMEEGKAYFVGPQGYVEAHPRKTDTHQHSSPGGTIEHEHSYLTGTVGLDHSHENGELVYERYSMRFTDDDILTVDDELGSPAGRLGKVECDPLACRKIIGVGGLPDTSTLEHIDGRVWECPRLDDAYETTKLVLADPEGHGCVLQTN